MRRKGQRLLRGSITAEEVKALQSALAAARLDNCGCKESAQQEMRLYLMSWVAGPIARVLSALEIRHAKGAPK